MTVRADPAGPAGTFVAAITDVVGVFSVPGIATLWFIRQSRFFIGP